MELWFLLSFGAAILTAFSSILEKKVLIKEHAMEFSATLAFSILLLSLPLFFFVDYNSLSLFFLVSIFFLCFLGALAFLFVAKSVRHLEVSEVSPILNLTPGVVVILAMIFLGEVLTIKQFSGVFLLLFGMYAIQLKEMKDFFKPFKFFKQKEYLKYILIAILLYSTLSIFDRFFLFNYGVSPITYVAFAHLFLAIHFLILLTIFHDGYKGIKKGFSKFGFWIVGMSLIVIAYRLSQTMAIKIAYVGLAVAVKRTSVFFTILLAGRFFHEKNIKKKLLSSAIMFLGVLLLI
jgi:transporter family protein